ncbi:vacuolar protein sorting-associated protein 41 homolog isoform X4 [Arachis stenosperma]|uniref:vacuolar protein sorting-associated protein 41 homolog isoform X4 n=1 Tax=Arachis stenosperma TaxID=217475 RepID=UPI0025ABBB26|nr:vacuolar protein sorting-associated protein 41 homolog isoform X4 [Arachis stenosperma]
MPTENPRLRDTAYEVALVALATNPSYHKDLLFTVKSWPSVIYSALPVISAIEPQLNTSSMTDSLKELMKPELFDFIDKYNLQDSIHEKNSMQIMIQRCCYLFYIAVSTILLRRVTMKIKQ